MPYYPLYRASAELYLWAGVLVSPVLCIFGWLLLGRAARKHLHSFVYWFFPAMIASSLLVTGLLLTAFLRITYSRDYALGTFVYLLSLAGVAFQVVSFVRLWKTITAMPPSAGEQPPVQNLEQDAGVWPPQPRR